MIHSPNSKAQTPVIQALTPLSTVIEQYDKFEIQLAIIASYNNPYDYHDIRIFATFESPDNRTITVDGFFMQDFEFNNVQTGSIQALHNGVFKIRFAPTLPGTWRYTVFCTNGLGTASFAEQTFECVAVTNVYNKGFIRKTNTNYLQYDTTEQFIPIGENMCWQVSNPYVDYKKWLDQLSAQGGNFIRIWQAHWGLGIEWKNNMNGFQGLRYYKQSNGFYLDWLFDYCAEKGVYIMFCLQHHGQVSTNVNPNWSDSPYNISNNGPCAYPWDFFTNQFAKNHVKNRLRYIIARWGYSRNVMCWELFNEVDWTDQYAQRKTAVANWLTEMAAFIKKYDPYQHLVSTSFAQVHHEPAVWRDVNIDVTQTHIYQNIANLERSSAKATRTYLTDFQKPTLVAEFGLGHSAEGLDELDSQGIHIHNALWATLFSGAMGAGASWWWDNYIEPQNLYHHVAPLAKITNYITFCKDNFKPASATVQGAPADLHLYPSLGWGALASTVFDIDNQGNIMPENAKLSAYLYGNQWNRQFRRPPTFKVQYHINGKFIVKTGARMSNRPKIAIWLDGVKKLEQSVTVNQSFTIEVPAGAHTIKVDNTGADWISIAAYTFTGLGSAVDAYVLCSANHNKFVGWVLNNRYNHEFIKQNGAPPAISGARIFINNVKNGNYHVKWLDCQNNSVIQIKPVLAKNNQVNVLIPNLLWDLTFNLTTPAVVVNEDKIIE